MRKEPEFKLEVLEQGQSRVSGNQIVIGENIVFSTEGLDSFALKASEPVLLDALVVAAAVEHCDRQKARCSATWNRTFSIKIPVKDPELWSSDKVYLPLRGALGTLTGDGWHIEFYRREKLWEIPQKNCLPLPSGRSAVIAYSDGMDSSPKLFGQRVQGLAVVGMGTEDFIDSLL